MFGRPNIKWLSEFFEVIESMLTGVSGRAFIVCST